MADQDQKQPESEVTQEAPGAAESAAGAEAAQADSASQARPGQAAEAGESAAPDSGAGEEPEAPDADRFAELQEELAQLKDVALRAQADAQNVKRRAEMDVEKARKFALESFARELLPVVDNLERALDAASGEDAQAKSIAEGVELTLKSLLNALKKFNIEPVDPQGEPFDPQLHQAMSMVEKPDAEPNTVITVMQKGYTLHDRLVRPAMVMVSKAAE